MTTETESKQLKLGLINPNPILRRYCWRTGLVLPLKAGERCPECGFSNHKPTPDQTKCGCFAPVDENSGSPCVLPIGHNGPHKAKED